MRIAIIGGSGKPESGGAFTLVETILEQLRLTESKNDFLFLYDGKYFEPYKGEYAGYTIVNINKVVSPWEIIVRNIYRKVGVERYNRCVDCVCEKEQIDLVWFINPCEYDVSFPYIYTVWDLGHREKTQFPELSRGIEWRTREKIYQKMLPRASYVIIGNESGKEEILENYPLPAKKIRIVNFPLSEYCYGDEKVPSFDLGKEYFVYPAQFWSHKNHIRIIEALALLKKEYGMSPRMVFTGSDKGNLSYVKERVEDYGLGNQVIFAGFVETAELKYLIKNAKAMIYASLLGPNNLPPMEAAYLGCPVLITDLPGHIEEMQDAGIYFNGYDEKDLAEKMYLVLSNEYFVSDKREKGFFLANEFEKVNYAEEICNIIEDFDKQLICWKKD